MNEIGKQELEKKHGETTRKVSGKFDGQEANLVADSHLDSNLFLNTIFHL
jgi:hypothetical protein